MLVSFRDDTPHSHRVVIAECVDLREPIAALYLSGRRADCHPIDNHSSRTTLLYLQGRYFHGAKRNIESAIEEL